MRKPKRWRFWLGQALFLAAFAQFFHYGLDEFLGVGQFLGDEADVQGGLGGIALGVAIDGVLADEDEGVGEAVEGDGEAAALGAEHLFIVVEFFAVFFKSVHGDIVRACWPAGQPESYFFGGYEDGGKRKSRAEARALKQEGKERAGLKPGLYTGSVAW